MERPPKRKRLSKLDLPLRSRAPSSLKHPKRILQLAPGDASNAHIDVRRRDVPVKEFEYIKSEQQRVYSELCLRSNHPSSRKGKLIEKRKETHLSPSTSQSATISAILPSTQTIFTTEILTVVTIPGTVLTSGPPIGPTIATILTTEPIPPSLTSSPPYSTNAFNSATATLPSVFTAPSFSVTIIPGTTSSFPTIIPASLSSIISIPPGPTQPPIPTFPSIPVPSSLPATSLPAPSISLPIPPVTLSVPSIPSITFSVPSIPSISLSVPSIPPIIISVGISIGVGPSTDTSPLFPSTVVQATVPAVFSSPGLATSSPVLTSSSPDASFLPSAPVPAPAPAPISADALSSGLIIPQALTGGVDNPANSQTEFYFSSSSSFLPASSATEINVSTSTSVNVPAAQSSPPAVISTTDAQVSGMRSSTGNMIDSTSSTTHVINGGIPTTMLTTGSTIRASSKAQPQSSGQNLSGNSKPSSTTKASFPSGYTSGRTGFSPSRSNGSYGPGYYGTGYTPGGTSTPTPTIGNSSASKHTTTNSVPTSVIAGSVVGGLAGLAFILLFLLLALRWWRTKEQRHERLDDTRVGSPPPSMSAETSERMGFLPAGLAGLAGLRRSNNSTPPPGSFERLSGRKLPSQWSPGMIGPVGPISSRSHSQSDALGSGAGYSSSALYPSGGTNQTSGTMDRIERETDDPFADPPATTGRAPGTHNADETFHSGPARMPTIHTPTHPHSSFLAAPELGQRSSRTTLGSRFSEEV